MTTFDYLSFRFAVKLMPLPSIHVIPSKVLQALNRFI